MGCKNSDCNGWNRIKVFINDWTLTEINPEVNKDNRLRLHWVLKGHDIRNSKQNYLIENLSYYQITF